MSRLFSNSEIVWGVAGLPGTGVTNGEKVSILDRLDELEDNVPPTVIADLTDVDTTGVADGDLLQWNATDEEWVAYTPEAITVVGGAGYVLDGGGAELADNTQGDLPPMAFSGTITGWALLADQSGDVSIGVWKDTLANYPPTIADVLFTMSISGATRSPTSGSYTAVSHAFSTGDIIRFNVTSATTIQKVTIGLRIEREVGP